MARLLVVETWMSFIHSRGIPLWIDWVVGGKNGGLTSNEARADTTGRTPFEPDCTAPSSYIRASPSCTRCTGNRSPAAEDLQVQKHSSNELTRAIDHSERKLTADVNVTEAYASFFILAARDNVMVVGGRVGRQLGSLDVQLDGCLVVRAHERRFD